MVFYPPKYNQFLQSKEEHLYIALGRRLSTAKGSTLGVGAFTGHEEKPPRAANLGLKTPFFLFFFARWLCSGGCASSSTRGETSLLRYKRRKEPSGSQFGGTEGLVFIKKAFYLK